MKKFMALVLVAAMCMCLFAGCGSSNSGTAATEAPTEASGSNTFKIGGSGPLTGDAAIYGTAVKNGGQIAIDEINANGGINGYQVEWKFEDDQADSEIAVNAYNTSWTGVCRSWPAPPPPAPLSPFPPSAMKSACL